MAAEKKGIFVTLASFGNHITQCCRTHLRVFLEDEEFVVSHKRRVFQVRQISRLGNRTFLTTSAASDFAQGQTAHHVVMREY